MRMLLVTLLLLFFVSSIKAQEAFVFKHGDCETRVRPKEHFLFADFISAMKARGYEPKEITKAAPLFEGEIYFEYEENRPKDKIFRDCVIKLSLKKAMRTGGGAQDETLYEHQIRRALPRFSFSGKERCRRAIKDVFVHIPFCQKP